tara:strand:- start:145 stop:861 length:717 start_codon:yes stop_codon:yes gene_type:complete
MELHTVVVVVVVISMIQSVFGVGVLLFGTPILLILGYDFVNALSVLLPISLGINFLQVVRDRADVDFSYYKMLLVYSIPPIVFLLAVTVEMNINVSLYIGAFLLLIAFKSWSKFVEKISLFVFKFQKSFLFFQGVVHGLTNLGGSLLTSHVFTLNLSKEEKRATISLSYFTFALFQILTLITLGELKELRVELIFLGILTYVFTDHFIYTKMSNKKYDKLFAVFLFFSGAVLMYRGVL